MPYPPSQAPIRYMLLSLAAGVVILALKFYAYTATGSSAIFSDALESVINVWAAGFGLYSAYLSSIPRDANHPYGHGKIEFVAAGFEGGMLLMASLAILYHGSTRLLAHHKPEALGQGLAYTALALVANLMLGIVLQRAGKHYRSLTLQVDGRHLIIDSWASAGLLVGLALVWITGVGWVDAATALLMGGWIVYESIKLIRISLSGLMDESDLSLVQRLVDTLANHRQPKFIDVHNLRAVRYGADIHIDCHVTLPWYFTLAEVHTSVKELEALLISSLGQNVELFIHADPCVPASCAICSMPNCAVRQQPQVGQVAWTSVQLATNRKHSAQQLPTTAA